MPGQDEYNELMSLKLDGLIDSQDEALLDEHLQGCADCRLLWAAMKQANDILWASVQAPLAVPSALYSKVMVQISATVPAWELNPLFRPDVAAVPAVNAPGTPLAATRRLESSPTGALPAGYYFARVRGLDPDGIEGPPSAVRHLGVVPVQLPPGSLADLPNHALIVPAHAQVSFGEPGPLEIAEGNGGYIQVPSSLTVDEQPEHLLRLRLKGDQSSESELRIEKRELRAEVQLTPHLPRWPKDPIDLYVNIEDPTGKMNPGAIQPHIEVLIGTHEVAIDWTHSGTVWAARLGPRNTHGPSVVRVIVRDQNGHLLGRNFVEVEGIPLPPSNELGGGITHQVAQN